MKFGIKDGKVYDICSELSLKRDDTIPDKDYIDKPYEGELVGDTFNKNDNTHLEDSWQRFEEKEKSELELKQEELEARIQVLEGAKK